jgi:hypothetical protein
MPPVRQTVAVESALEYWWDLVQAGSLDDIAFLWEEFDRRSHELRQVAKSEDISDAVWHLGRALDENGVFADWSLRGKRASILRAFRAARQ